MSGARKPSNWGTVVGYAFGGQAIYLLSQFGILSAISHLRGPEATGIFGLAVALTTPVFILANTGLRTVQNMDQSAEFSFEEYAGFRLYTTIAALVTCALVGIFYAEERAIYLMILLIAAAKSFETLSELSYGAFERRDRPEMVFRSLALRGTLTFVVFLIILWVGGSLGIAFFAQLLVWSLTALLLDFPAACRIYQTKPGAISITRARFWELLRRAVPVGGAGFAMGLQTSLLRITAESFLGLRALGIFTSIAYVYQAGGQMANALGFQMTARFSRMQRNGNEAGLRRQAMFLSLLMALFSALGLGVVWFFGGPILKIAFGPEVAEHPDLLLLVAAALAMRLFSTILSSLLYAKGGTVGILLREWSLVVLVVAAGAALMPGRGILGAGYALLVLAVARAGVSGLALIMRKRK